MSGTLYRRGSVTVEAVQVSEALRIFKAEPKTKTDTLPDWIQDEVKKGRISFRSETIEVKTPEGWDIAKLKGDQGRSDWIVRRQTEARELYAMRPSAFEKYRAVE